MTAPLVTADDVRDHAVQLMVALGGTHLAVASTLGRKGIKGTLARCRSCPIAVYLGLELAGVVEVVVEPSVIVLVLVTGEVVRVRPPGPVRDFIIFFDNLEHPRLIADGGAR